MTLRTQTTGWVSILTLITLLLATGCSKSEVVTSYEQVSAGNEYTKQPTQQEVNNNPVPIVFEASIGEQATTRGASVSGDTDLAHEGFNVLAYYIRNKYFPATTTQPTDGDADWESNKATWENNYASDENVDNVYPNFMYNQEIIGTVVGETVTGWTYTPMKYWPNETLTDGNGVNKDRLSFVAYGTHVDLATETHSLTKGGAKVVEFVPYDLLDPVGKYAYKTVNSSGVVAISRNDYTGEPFLIYNLKGDKDGLTSMSDMNDLLVAKITNLGDYERDHYNLSKQNSSIKFSFVHALSSFGFGVTGVFNALDLPINPGDPSDPYYSTEENKINDDNYIRIEEIKVKVSLPRKGVMNLISQSWSSRDEDEQEITFVMKADEIAENLRYPNYKRYKTIVVDGLDKVVIDEEATQAIVNTLNVEHKLLYYGVGRIYNPGKADDNRRIMNKEKVYQKVGLTGDDQQNLFYFIPPAGTGSEDVEFDFTITYHTLTADPRMPFGFGDVKNVVNKKVTLSMLQGDAAISKSFMFGMKLGMSDVKLNGVHMDETKPYYLSNSSGSAEEVDNTPYDNPMYYSVPKEES